MSPAGRDSLLGQLFAILRLDSLAQDSLDTALDHLSRSTSLSLNQRRDSVAQLLHAPPHLTAAQRDSLSHLAYAMVAPVATAAGSALALSLTTALGRALPTIALVLVLYGAIPAGLLTLTAAWWSARR